MSDALFATRYLAADVEPVGVEPQFRNLGRGAVEVVAGIQRIVADVLPAEAWNCLGAGLETVVIVAAEDRPYSAL